VTLPEPSDVTGSFEFVSITAFSGHTCAIEAGGGVYCWGANDFGQLGQDPSSLQESASPLRVPLT
jgi:alpha-tubulin suppressor-like RCC1 family protein